MDDEVVVVVALDHMGAERKWETFEDGQLDSSRRSLNMNRNAVMVVEKNERKSAKVDAGALE